MEYVSYPPSGLTNRERFWIGVSVLTVSLVFSAFFISIGFGFLGLYPTVPALGLFIALYHPNYSKEDMEKISVSEKDFKIHQIYKGHEFLIDLPIYWSKLEFTNVWNKKSELFLTFRNKKYEVGIYLGQEEKENLHKWLKSHKSKSNPSSIPN